MAAKKNDGKGASAAKKVKAVSPGENAFAAADAASEINAPRWSIVSFETVAAQNLTYAEAAEKLKRLDAQKISGLCVVTNEAAARISEKD